MNITRRRYNITSTLRICFHGAVLSGSAVSCLGFSGIRNRTSNHSTTVFGLEFLVAEVFIASFISHKCGAGV